MIQELTDCGPSRTYPVYYLEDAMNNLGDCFDYAVNDYGAEGSEVAELFCLSGVVHEFEHGNAWVVSGKSGVSLRSIQMYEQRQRSINEASVTTVSAIAKALHCNIEDLLEPAFEYKEPSAA